MNGLENGSQNYIDCFVSRQISMQSAMGASTDLDQTGEE